MRRDVGLTYDDIRYGDMAIMFTLADDVKMLLLHCNITYAVCPLTAYYTLTPTVRRRCHDAAVMSSACHDTTLIYTPADASDDSVMPRYN